jgi:phage tail tape-measure protein
MCKRAMARGGMARGGVAMSVGGDVGRWLGDWFQGWLGFADGGEVLSKSEIQDAVADLSSKEQDKLIKEVTADFKDAVDAGEVKMPAGAPAMSVGGDIGQWLGDWFQSWLGFARGGRVYENGGSIKSVFY